MKKGKEVTLMATFKPGFCILLVLLPVYLSVDFGMWIFFPVESMLVLSIHIVRPMYQWLFREIKPQGEKLSLQSMPQCLDIGRKLTMSAR